MDKERAKQKIKAQIKCTAYLERSKDGMYCCPFCGSGHGPNETGALKYYKDTNTWHCFSARCNRSGDVIDLYKAWTGTKDYNEALAALAGEIGITIDQYRPARETDAPGGARGREPEAADTETPEDKIGPQGPTESPTEAPPDFMAYYRECRQHLRDPAAVKYLERRGISLDTAEAYWIGYDQATGFLIIPCSESYYANRNTGEGQRFKNPPGASVELFNVAALWNEGGRPVFITESAIDALSIIEAGGVAVGLNGAGNYGKLLAKLDAKHTDNMLILCLDTDEAGKSATGKLIDGLTERGMEYAEAEVCGGHKDPNEALTAGRAEFIEAVTTTEKAIRYPGLLTTARAIATLEAVDDHYLEMDHFPELSSTAKIRTHDTIVIAADTGAGKSSLALNFLHDLQDRYPAIYVNLEMDEATVLQRLIAIHTGIDLDEIEGYKHDQRTRAKVGAAIREITARREIQLLEDAYDLDEIEKQIKAATAGRTEPTIVFIDTGLLVTTAGKTSSRYERFTEISEKLRRISRLNNVVVFVLLQQNRESKKDDKKEPKNSSLKESGSWENDATKIMFLWSNPKTRRKELTITKNRSGKTGSIELNYAPHTQTYSEAKGSFTPYDGETPFDEEQEEDFSLWEPLSTDKKHK